MVMTSMAQRFADAARRLQAARTDGWAGWLVGPDAIGAAVVFERDAIAVRRTRLAAVIFAVLIVAWTAVDVLALGPTAGGLIGVGRVMAGAGFALVAVYCSAAGRPKARVALALLFAVPLPFYTYAMFVLYLTGIDLSTSAIATTYVELPFIAVACIALFPLGAIEGALLALPYVLAAVAVASLPGAPFAGVLDFGVAWLVAVVALIAIVASVSQLRFMTAVIDQSSRDALTGTLSRRVGEEILRVGVGVARRQGTPFAAVFVDLDHFKSVNDSFGHLAGDALLRGVGATLADVVRRQDAVIRWGGEEFVILLPGTTAAGAARLVTRIGARGLALRPDGQPQTASVGYAEISADGIVDGAALVALADARMYRAKQAGRNRVVGPEGTPAIFHDPGQSPGRIAPSGLAAA